MKIQFIRGLTILKLFSSSMELIKRGCRKSVMSLLDIERIQSGLSVYISFGWSSMGMKAWCAFSGCQLHWMNLFGDVHVNECMNETRPCEVTQLTLLVWDKWMKWG